ncbi:DUF2804 domain-containing protein [Actinomadura madurae]|uniref:DUF2804 family protein n=1 Tax=Actinomadura madurae TaxID=1993 RepID=UPI001FD52859|nr:DUF2804 family protein [Actinomadura madurae]
MRVPGLNRSRIPRRDNPGKAARNRHATGRSGGCGSRPSSVRSTSGSRGRNSASSARSASRPQQCFGHFSGRARTDGGTWIDFDDLTGWAEESRQRW